jgi:hypothetical protein
MYHSHADVLAQQDRIRHLQAAWCGFFRDIHGYHSHSARAKNARLLLSDSTSRRLAETIYQERAYDRLPILADALEESGCNQQDVLTHLRSGGEHVRGCWALDLVTGRE